jgi:hypothetical protein
LHEQHDGGGSLQVGVGARMMDQWPIRNYHFFSPKQGYFLWVEVKVFHWFLENVFHLI